MLELSQKARAARTKPFTPRSLEVPSALYPSSRIMALPSIVSCSAYHTPTAILDHLGNIQRAGWRITPPMAPIKLVEAQPRMNKMQLDSI